ncbi:hypothetical protein GYMLUDRAFT_61786 [Collybiopsis luxurians FD-317 M1]|uniref:Unplaced genomic scaffold GYMLUscaffold_47, whole genome shotgun sequence n=1 Tax=Collybiopsis luxurians FD-317 M1 TaxID=944289 RepID=A0A0D0BNW2_9AGAR|nr:hypothetical protein GYMLUDRAFT_61786 [Collybiopsis luxurians FD-317 M1]
MQGQAYKLSPDGKWALHRIHHIEYFVHDSDFNKYKWFYPSRNLPFDWYIGLHNVYAFMIGHKKEEIALDKAMGMDYYFKKLPVDEAEEYIEHIAQDMHRRWVECMIYLNNSLRREFYMPVVHFSPLQLIECSTENDKWSMRTRVFRPTHELQWNWVTN